MASRRSRRSGEDSVQERLATLAAMKQLMGDPMRDLGGLMSLQRASEESAQGQRDEERAVRQEAFAQDQAAWQQREMGLKRRQDYDIGQQAFRMDLANRADAAKAQRATEAVQERTLALQAQELGLKEAAQNQAMQSQLDPPVAQQVSLLAGMAQAGVNPESPEFKSGLAKLGSLMEGRYDREPVPTHEWVLNPRTNTYEWLPIPEEPAPPESEEDVKKALDELSPFDEGGSIGGWA